VFGVFLDLRTTFGICLLLVLRRPRLSLVCIYSTLNFLYHPFLIFGLPGISLVLVFIEPNLCLHLVMILLKLALRILILILWVFQAVLPVWYVLNFLFGSLASSDLLWTEEISALLRLSNWPRIISIRDIYLLDLKVIIRVLSHFKLVGALRGHPRHLLLWLVFRCTRQGPRFRVVFILYLWLIFLLYLQWAVWIVSRLERSHCLLLLHRPTFLSRRHLVRLLALSSHFL